MLLAHIGYASIKKGNNIETYAKVIITLNLKITLEIELHDLTLSLY